MKIFSLNKYKAWCVKHGETMDSWAQLCAGRRVYGYKNEIKHCIDGNGRVWYVSDEWITKK